MLLKLIIFLVLLYFVGRSIRNMMRAVLNDPKAGPAVPPRPRQDRGPRWQGGSPGQTPRPGADVEDAKWVDLD